MYRTTFRYHIYTVFMFEWSYTGNITIFGVQNGWLHALVFSPELIDTAEEKLLLEGKLITYIMITCNT